MNTLSLCLDANLSLKAQATTKKFSCRLKHVDRRMLEGLTGWAVENVGQSKHFYLATIKQSRLSLSSDALIVHMAAIVELCCLRLLLSFTILVLHRTDTQVLIHTPALIYICD